MSNSDPLMKVVEIVNGQLDQGKSEREVIDFLVSSGLPEEKSQKIVATVIRSNKSPVRELIVFLLVSLLFLFVSAFVLYGALGERTLIASAKWFGMSFFVLFAIFGILGEVKGKLAYIFRLVSLGGCAFTSFLFSASMYMHPGWSESWLGSGGGWRAQLLSFAGNLIYSMGSKGVAYFSLLVSTLILVVLWSTWKNGPASTYGTK